MLLFPNTSEQIDRCLADLVACNPLGPVKDVNNPPGVIINFIYDHHKDRIWARKSLLKHFKNARNRQPVFLSAKLENYDRVKKQTEVLDLFVPMSNSTSHLHF